MGQRMLDISPAWIRAEAISKLDWFQRAVAAAKDLLRCRLQALR